MSFKYQADELAVQSPALGQHFVTHTEQSLHWSVCALATMDQTVVHMNGCKSVNHIMRIGIEWKPRRLVNYLHTVADVRHRPHTPQPGQLHPHRGRLETRGQTCHVADHVTAREERTHGGVLGLSTDMQDNQIIHSNYYLPRILTELLTLISM